MENKMAPSPTKSIIGRKSPEDKYNVPDLTPLIDKYLEEHLDEAKPKEKTPEGVQPAFSSSNDFWTIENVPYRNGIYKVDLLKTLLDNGNSKTQDDWAEYLIKAKQNNSFYVGDFPLYHSLFTSLYKLKDKQETEEIRNFLEKQFSEKWLATLTRIKYNSAGEDEIIHNYKMPDEYSIKYNFVGPDEFVKNSNNSQNYKSLLGTDAFNEINSIYNWITKEDIYLSRINSKPKNLDERIAGFAVGFNRAYLNCGRGPPGADPALGVRAKVQGAAK